MRDELQKYRFYSKALLTSTVIMIGAVLMFFMCYSYNQNLENAERKELDKLLTLTRTLALNIDGDIHKSMVCNHLLKDEIKTNTENKTYQKFHELLKQAQEVNELETPIYTLFRNKSCNNDSQSQASVFFGVSSSEEPIFRHTYEEFPKCLIDNYEVGATVGEYQTENGRWLSSFFPIKNRKGETVGVVQADRPFDEFITGAQAKLFNESIYALVFIFLLSILFFIIYRWMLQTMSKINMALEKAVVDRTEKLNKSNLDLQKFTTKLEVVVAERTKELELSNRKLKSYAHVASHDLQSPLRMITSFAQLFKKKYEDVVDEDGKVYLDYIISNTKKMAGLIGDILSTSYLSNENTKAVQSVDLNGVVENVASNLEMEISKYNAQINYNNLPTIRGFSSDFVQLFQNFISNSIKYSRQGIFPIINISTEKIEDSFLMKISDNGKGISEEALKNIFEEFNRGDATDDGGFGIGLATCKRIIKEYHGELQVSSLVNVGTTFEFLLKDRDAVKDTYEAGVDASFGVALKN